MVSAIMCNFLHLLKSAQCPFCLPDSKNRKTYITQDLLILDTVTIHFDDCRSTVLQDSLLHLLRSPSLVQPKDINSFATGQKKLINWVVYAKSQIRGVASSEVWIPPW